MNKIGSNLLASAIIVALSSTVVNAANFLVDLTHPTPTFKASATDPMKADLSKPYFDSKPIPTFGGQTVRNFHRFPTNQGYFDTGVLILAEHHGTHMDTPAHYVNNEKSQEAGFLVGSKRKYTHQMDVKDLIGKVVMIDISSRVQTELDKNGGSPSSDKNVTNFSNDTQNVVTADDIENVASQLEDGVWLVLNTGWSRFYFDGPDFGKGPYVNGFNFPGINKKAVDKLIEILDKKKIRINGIVADNISVDSGQSGLGDDGKLNVNSFYAHVRLMQRGLIFVENATNLGQLALANPGSCTLVVGALKHVGGAGGPSRVMALCEQ